MPAAAGRRAHEHEVARARPRDAIEDHPPAALEERLCDEEAPALVDDGDGAPAVCCRRPGPAVFRS
jgi:hypothetical protein